PSRPVFFFFQAEDGIRGFHVTGVQTCALPIYTGNLHRVYARCNEFHAEVRELSSVVTYRNRSATLRASGSFLDLTALFERHGFRRIAARPSFYAGGSEIGAEWWHFQDEAGLVPGKTTFGDELLKIYSRETLEPTPPWRYRNYVFGVNWR